MNEFLQRLIERKLVQWTVAYCASAFALVQLLDIVAQRFGWPDYLVRFTFIALAVGFFVTLVVAWYHGERGAQRVTGTELLILALLLALGGGFLWRFAGASHERIVRPDAAPAATATAPSPAAISERSIAVLPFVNMSTEKDSEFFTAGIHEDILTKLALIRELHVVSRTSVMQYRDTTKPIREIARDLGVANILEGSVQRAGNRVRVTGQLVRAATDEHIWANSYDRDLTDMFSIQSELATAIAQALSTVLSPAEKQLVDSRPTENLAAYDAYAKAREQLQQGSTAGFLNLEPLLQTAVLLDPKFAQAWAELASVHARLYFDDIDRTSARLEKAKAAIDKAVSLAPDDPTVIQKLGDYYYYGYRDYKRASEQYQRLVDQYPNSAPAFASLGFIHRRQGRWSDALAELRRAVQLEPSNIRYSSALMETLEGLDLYDEAEAVQRQIVAQAPDSLRQTALLAVLPFVARGSLTEYQAWLAQIRADPRQEATVQFLRVRFGYRTGDLETAIRILREQRGKDGSGDRQWSDDVDFAGMLWLHGDTAEARTVAEKALVTGQAEAERQPSATTWQSLSTAFVVLGNNAEALRCAQAAKDLVPESEDAWTGPAFSLHYAKILAWVGEKDRALAELARLLRTPNSANIYELQRDPGWRVLRGNPRFEALVKDPANNAPLLP
jgi:TolB-like protein/Flp pilus assembly protein TadD